MSEDTGSNLKELLFINDGTFFEEKTSMIEKHQIPGKTTWEGS